MIYIADNEANALFRANALRKQAFAALEGVRDLNPDFLRLLSLDEIIDLAVLSLEVVAMSLKKGMPATQKWNPEIIRTDSPNTDERTAKEQMEMGMHPTSMSRVIKFEPKTFPCPDELRVLIFEFSTFLIELKRSEPEEMRSKLNHKLSEVPNLRNANAVLRRTNAILSRELRKHRSTFYASRHRDNTKRKKTAPKRPLKI